MPVFLAMASAYCSSTAARVQTAAGCHRIRCHGIIMAAGRGERNMNEGAVPWLDLPDLCSRALLCGEISSQKHVF